MTPREFEAQLSADFAAKLLAALPEPAFIVAGDGRVAANNAPALLILPALKIGDHFVLAMRAPTVIEARRRAIAGGQAQSVQWSERVPVERLFEVCVAPLSDDAGKVFATLITLRDLTEQRRVERMRVDFIANASHELRTPLASMLGFVETLQGSAKDDPKAREKFLPIMREQGQRMSRLIDDLLSLSRIEQKQHLRPEGIVDLCLVTRHVVDSLAPLAQEMRVNLALSADGPLMVTGDRDELTRVAENLIENAIKYGSRQDSSDHNLVEIAVTGNDREAILSVRDFGYGIAAEHLPRLTERFYRVDAHQSRAKNGTGLGLAIVKHIMTRHRGRLSISSQANRGSVFAATVPLHLDEPNNR